jgi:hypothetical protein
MRKILIAALVASSAIAAAPAAAQHYGYRDAPQIHRQLQQLSSNIRRAEDRDVISRREESRMLRQVRSIDRLYDRYRRNGLSNWEVRDLQNRIHHLRQQLRFERREARW